MANPPPADTGTRIREAISRSGKSKTAIAEALSVTPQAVYGWETTGRISKEKLAEFAELVGVPMQTLLGYQEDSAASSPQSLPDTPERHAGKASESVRLDDDKLERAIRFLERQFALWDREFVASDNVDLITGVYARIGAPQESNLIQLSQWLSETIGRESKSHVEQRRVRGAGKSDR